MARSKMVAANKKIEDAVVEGYKKIENGVAGGFKKMSDKFVDNYLTKDGESVEEAKQRLTSEQKIREEQAKKGIEDRKQQQQDLIKESVIRVESHRR